MNEFKFFALVVVLVGFLSGLIYATDDGKTCETIPFGGPTVCHTQEEWDQISEENWKWVECSNSQPEHLTYLEVEERCGGREVIHSVEFE